jgi:hypothetical protein
MNNHDFWTDYAEAMELSIEGNRLIAQEITQWVRGLGRGIVRSLNALLQSLGHQEHLPPV